MSRVNYTMSLISLVQDLDRYSEEDLVKKLAKHHEVDIRFTVKARGIKQAELYGPSRIQGRRDKRKTSERARNAERARESKRSKACTYED